MFNTCIEGKMFKTNCNGLNYLGSRCKRFPFDNPTVKKQQYEIKS